MLVGLGVEGMVQLSSVLGGGEAAGELQEDVAYEEAGGARDEAGAADKVECASELDICFPSEAIAQPANAPAAPVAESTSPDWPFAAVVVVVGR